MGQSHSFVWHTQIPPSGVVENFPKELLQHFKSLRLELQETFIILNGQGQISHLKVISTKPFQAEILSQKQESPALHQIELCLAPPKRDSLWEAVAQATEMGIHRLSFLRSQHVQYKSNDESGLIDRSKRVIEAACAQSQRPWGVHVNPQFLSLRDVFTESDRCTIVVADENLSSQGLIGFTKPDSLKIQPHIKLLIGPEGGWSEAERALFLDRTHSLGLGKQILRVPTACVSALTLLKWYIK